MAERPQPRGDAAEPLPAPGPAYGGAEGGVRLLITLRSSDHYRFVESIVAEVVRRGGSAALLAKDAESLGRLAKEAASDRVRVEPALPNRRWSARLLRVTREVRSYLHWLRLRVQPDFLLERWLDYIPRPIRGLLRFGRRLGLERLMAHRWTLGALAWIEAVTTPGEDIQEQIRSIRPDLALITPLVYPDAWEVDYLKACHRLGQANAALVASWDNLTSKGVFHVRPEVVLVWNQIQVEEAIRYHSLPPSSVIPSGAAVFDWLFEPRWLEPRDEFCRSLGLDPGLPYVLYAVSSSIQRGDETEIVRNLHRHLASIAPGQVQILVRPHPRNTAGWEGFGAPGVRIGFPPAGMERAAAKKNLLNTLVHCAAVVGLNTSVFLEAAILNRPGLILKSAGLARGQAHRQHTEFPHFQYLLDGAFLDVMEDEQAAAKRIVEILRGGDRNGEARTAFVDSFVRPHGREIPAGWITVNILEQRAGHPAATAAQPGSRAARHEPQAGLVT